jgi:exonuclease SbcD
MRILHTSDWHLNEKLGQIKRQEDICSRLEEIAGYLEQQKVDVMLVSGDIFSNTIRMDEVREAFKEVTRIFRPFLLRKGTIIGIGGNHDSEDLFNVVRLAMDLAVPQEGSVRAPKDPGRLYLYERSGYLTLNDPQAGQVQFCLLPYPTPNRYLKDEGIEFNTIEERNRLLHDKLRERLLRLQTDYVQVEYPTVLVSHLHVRGNRLHNLYHLSESRDVVFDLADLPLSWAYSAFGHIHLPQDIRGSVNARYAGSIDRFDFAEADDQKSVVVFDVGRGGLIGAPTILPLNATPLYKIEVHDPSEIASLPDRYPDGQRAIVDYQVVYKPGDHNPDAMRDDIERMFPRWCRRSIDTENDFAPEPDETGRVTSPAENVPERVREYLRRRLPDNSDREELLTLAEELLASI